jgi:hypothetical protein
MESDVPGLYLAGQDVTTAGFAGALNGGALTAMKILGYGAAPRRDDNHNRTATYTWAHAHAGEPQSGRAARSSALSCTAYDERRVHVRQACGICWCATAT